VVVAVLAVVGTAALLALAALTDGTNDVDTWLAFLDASDAVGALHLYGVESWPTVPTFDFSHGLLTALSLPFVGGLVDMGVAARFIVRVPAVFADAAATFMVFHLVRHRLGDRAAVIAAALIALNPVLVLVAGFHGNTDRVFVAFLLGSLVYARRGRHVPAGVAFALAAGVKIVPLAVVPFFFIGLGTVAARKRFFGAAVGTSAILWAPVLLIGFRDVVSEVFLYGGSASSWGLGRAAWWVFGFDPDGPVRLLWSLALAVVVMGVAARVARRGERSADWSLGVAFLVMLAASPGSGLQYLAWPVPFLVIVWPRAAALYSGACALHLYARYAYLSGGGLALGHADSWGFTPGTPLVRLTGIAAWAVTAALAVWMLGAPTRAGAIPEGDRDVPHEV
jgi:hypothetical protein